MYTWWHQKQKWLKPDECDQSLCLYCRSTTWMMLQPLDICYHQLQLTTVILLCWQQPFSLDHNWYMFASCWHFTQYFVDMLNCINCINYYQRQFWWSFDVGRRSSPLVYLSVCLFVNCQTLYREWHLDILEVVWFGGWKVKGQGHRVNKCIFHNSIRSKTQKRMIP